MPDTFWLWDELKAYARDYAATDRSLPIDVECEIWLERLLVERLPQTNLNGEVRRFYTQELCAMITACRAARYRTEANSLCGRSV